MSFLDIDEPFLDIEAVRRFVDTVTKNHEESCNRVAYKLATKQPINQNEEDSLLLKGVSMADVRAANLCLAVLLRTTVDVRKELGLKARTGPRKKRLNQTIHSPEFDVVTTLESGVINYTEAVKELTDKFHVGETAAQEFIADRRAAAAAVVGINDVILKKTKPR